MASFSFPGTGRGVSVSEDPEDSGDSGDTWDPGDPGGDGNSSHSPSVGVISASPGSVGTTAAC